jgi:hypothetical protein
MASFFRSSVRDFCATPRSEVLAQLTLAYAHAGFAEMKSDTPIAWWNDLQELQAVLRSACETNDTIGNWWVLLEFTIPRKLSRIDIVLLAGEEIVLLECKSSEASNAAVRQVEAYSLLLHYFHKPSRDRRITPLIVSHRDEGGLRLAVDQLSQQELSFRALPSHWIRKPHSLAWSEVATCLVSLSRLLTANQLDGVAWDDGEYRPTPTIIEAAMALRTGLHIGEVAQSEAAEEYIARVRETIQTILSEAHAASRHAIIFLTGVPGSGKTLVGLSLAHLAGTQEDAVHFMSGNGPLVNVLQSVFRRHAMHKGIPAGEAQIEAETLIEDVHLFAKEYTENRKDVAPSNHVVIFDEAQRAWDFEHSRAKFGRSSSEPTMFLRIMERHSDWQAWLL